MMKTNWGGSCPRDRLGGTAGRAPEVEISHGCFLLQGVFVGLFNGAVVSPGRGSVGLVPICCGCCELRPGYFVCVIVQSFTGRWNVALLERSASLDEFFSAVPM